LAAALIVALAYHGQMCGRYVSPDEASIERAIPVQRRNWSLLVSDLLGGSDEGPFAVSYNVAPTDPVPVVRVVREIDGNREGVRLRWGLIPHWANGKAAGISTINARAETVRTKPAFRTAWRRGQRCLVALAGFYEWQAQPPDWQRTVPFYITVADQDPFFLAGLWDKSTADDGTVIESVTVITTPANALLAGIHNSRKAQGTRGLLEQEERRMPAILAKEDHETWLSGTDEEAFALLKPYPAELMVAWPVSGRVNSVRNRGPELIVPVDVTY
jgi:putative SOS response-associated peptidase YedK